MQFYLLKECSRRKFLNESKIYLLSSFFNKYKTKCTDLVRINLEVKILNFVVSILVLTLY